MAEEHLQAVLAQGHQVLVEAQVRQPQQLPQVQLGDAGRSAPGPGRSARSAWAGHPRKPCTRPLRATYVGTCFLYAAPGVSRLFASLAQIPDCSRGRGVTRAGGVSSATVDGEADGSSVLGGRPWHQWPCGGCFRCPLLPWNPGFNHRPLRSPRAIISGAAPEQRGGSSEPRDTQCLRFRSPASDVGQDQGYFWLLTSPAPSENPSPAANESPGGAAGAPRGRVASDPVIASPGTVEP